MHTMPFSDEESSRHSKRGQASQSDGTSAEAVPYDVYLRFREYIGCIMDYSFYTPDEQPEGEGLPRYRNWKKE